MRQPYRSELLDHLGRVAGMFGELGFGDVVEPATRQDPEMRTLTADHAVKGVILN